MTDIVDRLRSRAEAPNAWTRKDYFLLEAAAEIETLRQQAADWKKIIVQKDKEIERLQKLMQRVPTPSPTPLLAGQVETYRKMAIRKGTND